MFSEIVTNSYGESQSRTNESWLKKSSPQLKMLRPLCSQTVNLNTDSKTLYYSILKLKYRPSIIKHNKGLKKCALLNNSHNNCHRNYTNGIFLQIHMFRSIDQSLHPTGCMPWILLLLWEFLCVMDAGRRGTFNTITESYQGSCL